jgi:hypothetical protein
MLGEIFAQEIVSLLVETLQTLISYPISVPDGEELWEKEVQDLGRQHRIVFGLISRYLIHCSCHGSYHHSFLPFINLSNTEDFWLLHFFLKPQQNCRKSSFKLIYLPVARDRSREGLQPLRKRKTNSMALLRFASLFHDKTQ